MSGMQGFSVPLFAIMFWTILSHIILCSNIPISSGIRPNDENQGTIKKPFPCDCHERRPAGYNWEFTMFFWMTLANCTLASLKTGVSWAHIKRKVKPHSSCVASVVAVRGAEVLLPWVFYREMEQAIFTSVSTTARLQFKAKHQRGCKEGLPLHPRPGVGQTKGLTACLA